MKRKRFADFSFSPPTKVKAKPLHKREVKVVETGFEPIFRVKNQHPEPHTLILGTFPSVKSFGRDLAPKEVVLRGGSGPQNYGNPNNSFFNIMGSAIGFKRSKCGYEEQICQISKNGFAIWDVLSQCVRPGSLDSSLDFSLPVAMDVPFKASSGRGRPIERVNSIENEMLLNNIPELLCSNSSFELIIIPSNSADVLNKKSLRKVFEKHCLEGKISIMLFSLKKSSTFDVTSRKFKSMKCFRTFEDENELNLASTKKVFKVRFIEIKVLPSTSPASAKLRPFDKEKIWHRECFRLESTPESYYCPACEESSSSHWLADCRDLNQWRQQKRKEKQTQDIDHFRWYL